jgi:hypothetical protein
LSLLEKGQAKLADGDFTGALKTLTQAKGKTSDPTTLAQVELTQGLCFGALQKFSKAEGAFTRALTHDPDVALDPVHVDPALVSLLNTARAKLHAQLVVTGGMGARLTWDGAVLGTTPFEGQVPIGTHVLGWSRPSGPGNMKVVAHAQQTVEVSLPPATEATVAAPSKAQPATPAPLLDSALPMDSAPAAVSVSTGGPSPEGTGVLPRVWGILEGRLLVDPTAGVGAQVGAGVSTRLLHATLSGTAGAAQGGTLSVGGHVPRLLGPVGLYASLDGVALLHPAVLLGGGATLGGSLFLSRYLDLLVEAQVRHLQASTTFQSDYVLVNLGLRLHFVAQDDR